MARCAVKPTPWNVMMGTVGFGLFAAVLPRESVGLGGFGGRTVESGPSQRQASGTLGPGRGPQRPESASAAS